MSTVKVPVGLFVVVLLVLVAIVVYLYCETIKLSENIVSNEQLKLENEKLALLETLKINQQLENFQTREPIGFKLA